MTFSAQRLWARHSLFGPSEKLVIYIRIRIGFLNFLFRDLQFPSLNFNFGVFLQTPINFTEKGPIQLLPEISYFESGRAAPGDRSNLGLDRGDLPGRCSKFEKR